MELLILLFLGAQIENPLHGRSIIAGGRNALTRAELRQGLVLLRAQGLKTTEKGIRKCVKCNSHGLIRLAYSEAVHDLFQKGIDHIDVPG